MTKRSDADRAAAVGAAITAAIRAQASATDLGFEYGAFGELHATGCRVTLYRVGDDWEVDITLANGGGLAFDVPCGDVSWQTAEEWAIAQAQRDELHGSDLVDVDGHDWKQRQ
jgi:hypothetical protein